MNEKEIRSLSNDQLVEIKNNITGENMNEDRITRLEASVSALINAFKAAAEEAEEEKKVQMKAEEEEALHAEEEAEKMVPVSKVATEEEEKEEDKEDKDEKKIEKLEAAIAQLTSMIASKITPETPEDEPANTTHSIPKVSNEPVKSEKLKDGFKFPLTTGGMIPGKIKAKGGRAQGQSMAFTGAIPSEAQDSEQRAVDEIFGFAASRGTVPMIADSRIRTIRYK